MLRYQVENIIRMKSTFSVIRLFVILCMVIRLNAQERIITTGVPFLLTHQTDCWNGGAVATSADAYSQQWNPAKYSFSESKSGWV